MAPLTYKRMAGPRVPLRLALSYVVDWIAIVAIAAVGAAFWKKTPNRRPFSPVDPSISFPYVLQEKISTSVLATISLIIPAVLTAVLALILTPSSGISSGRTWRQKCWEWNTAWMGLGLALATTLLFTEGIKDVIGKPRPDLLSRCDLDPAVVQGFVVGGLGQGLPLWNVLVEWTSCRQTDTSKLRDGFQSFPSGHSSFSWTGMFYLTLYVCSKLSITIPYLLPYAYTTQGSQSDVGSRRVGREGAGRAQILLEHDDVPVALRKQAAAPPAYLFIFALFPVGVATYVSSTRYSDFRHHGFDILFGSLMGIFISWGSFRIYHLPIQRGAGWAWGPRSPAKAWGIRMGVTNYAEDEGDFSKKRDVEMGEVANGIGTGDGGIDTGRSANSDHGGFSTPLSKPSGLSKHSGLPPGSRHSARDSRLQRPNDKNLSSEDLPMP